jgi:hypothetical protein
VVLKKKPASAAARKDEQAVNAVSPSRDRARCSEAERASCSLRLSAPPPRRRPGELEPRSRRSASVSIDPMRWGPGQGRGGGQGAIELRVPQRLQSALPLAQRPVPAPPAARRRTSSTPRRRTSTVRRRARARAHCCLRRARQLSCGARAPACRHGEAFYGVEPSPLRRRSCGLGLPACAAAVARCEPRGSPDPRPTFTPLITDERVSTELKKQIVAARTAKKLTQAQLGQVRAGRARGSHSRARAWLEVVRDWALPTGFWPCRCPSWDAEGRAAVCCYLGRVRRHEQLWANADTSGPYPGSPATMAPAPLPPVQLVNEKPSVIQEYESGKAIPNPQARLGGGAATRCCRAACVPAHADAGCQRRPWSVPWGPSASLGFPMPPAKPAAPPSARRRCYPSSAVCSG